MGLEWTQAGSSALAAFFASLVEFIEALTVVLAIGAVRGWTGALIGTGIALSVLLVLVIVAGPGLTGIPLDLVQSVVGMLLLLFGLRWLRKAVLRKAGVIPLHDEDAAFAKETTAMQEHGSTASSWDRIAIMAAFKIVMVEGIEVVFIVIAIGTRSGVLIPAAGGAMAALTLVVLLGFLLHRPVAMIPENTLKFVVGVLLSAFGTFWVGESMGGAWPGADWSLLGLIVGYWLAALGCVWLARRASARLSEVKFNPRGESPSHTKI